MKIILLFISLSVFLFITDGSAQTSGDSTLSDSIIMLKGVIKDYSNSTPLAYANIAVQNTSKGSISNEKGFFAIDITGLSLDDSLSFQYIGYKTKTISLEQLNSSKTIYLKEDIQNLNQVYVFANPLKAKEIIKKVIENKEANYNWSSAKSQMFIRNKSIEDINQFKLNYKKSSFSQLDEKFIASIPNTIPKHSTSYTDFLGHIYYSTQQLDSSHFKIAPIKMVSLKDKDIADLDQLESVFEDLVIDTKEKEYWKAKSGIFGARVNATVSDTNESNKTASDTIVENKGPQTVMYQYQYGNQLKYSSLNDEDDWEFLYSPGKYDFTLLGGTQVNGEDVYIIEFKPHKNGNFIGRVYISIQTYALIRADYEYDENKHGTDINLLGVGFTENVFKASILFEKDNDKYRLKYCAKKTGEKIRIDRNITLLKKRERFLFDKTLKEVKVGLELSMTTIHSFEILVLDRTNITEQQFKSFKQKKYQKLVYVDQFNDQLWEGYSIIEPTKQMREYKKME